MPHGLLITHFFILMIPSYGKLQKPSYILDIKKANTDQLLATIQWWEKKRIWFNIIVGALGVISILLFNSGRLFSGWISLVGIIIWGIAANIFYSSGILLEVVNVYYLKSSKNFFRFRYPLFIIGTLLYSMVTIIYAFNRYIYFNQF
jgi:hypothetical protein